MRKPRSWWLVVSMLGSLASAYFITTHSRGLALVSQGVGTGAYWVWWALDLRARRAQR